MAKPVIRAILSDWGRVVVHFDNHRVPRSLKRECGKSYSLLATPSDLLLYQRLFVDCRELCEIYMRGHMSTPQFRYLVRNVLRLDKDCKDDILDRAFGDVFDWNMPMVEFQQQKRMEGVRLTAVSNVEEIRHRWLQAMGIDELFDVLNLSYLERVAKPDPEFLRRAIVKTGLPPGECLFLDDLEDNIASGVPLGLRVWRYLPEKHAEFLDFAAGLDFRPAAA